MEEIKDYLSRYSWFFDVKEDGPNIIVYVNTMDLEVFNTVPLHFKDKKVLIYFAKSLTFNKKDYCDNVDLFSIETNLLN